MCGDACEALTDDLKGFGLVNGLEVNVDQMYRGDTVLERT